MIASFKKLNLKYQLFQKYTCNGGLLQNQVNLEDCVVYQMHQTVQMQLFLIGKGCICSNMVIPINKKLTTTQSKLK